MPSDRATPLPALVSRVGVTLLIAGAALAIGVPGARAQAVPVERERLTGYVSAVARAWEPYTTADGRVADPLDATDTGDNYGVILLADTMLKVARTTGDSALEGTATRIVASALTLPVPNDPFNLLAIAAAIHDGQAGDFPAGAWQRVAGPLMQRAGQIEPPTEATCLTEPFCYDNWRLVWSAGASLLLSDHVAGVPGSLASDGVSATAQIGADLAMAIDEAGAPLALALASEGARAPLPPSRAAPTEHGTRRPSRRTGGHGAHGPASTLAGPAAGGSARELSDPGAEPPAYELFSTFMLELIGEVDPHAIAPAVARLRRQADRYALDMMAPDGQLSLSGRSLDQSWVQAAAAALGARQAALQPAKGGAWRAYADRALSYLLAAYPIRGDGLIPIVPGLDLEWNPSIMDGYAALNQYEGLTLWLLSDALARWPSSEARRASLPADSRELLADDLGSSGLVWGRSGGVWWEVGGRSIGHDPRSAQGLVAVKTADASGWRDLLALRPRHGGPSSAWTLALAHGASATPTFAHVRGTGGRAVLTGVYRRANGRFLARARWALSTTATGLRVSMSVPANATLHATIWLAGADSARVFAPAATVSLGACVVTASGQACPLTLTWNKRRAAWLEVGS